MKELQAIAAILNEKNENLLFEDYLADFFPVEGEVLSAVRDYYHLYDSLPSVAGMGEKFPRLLDVTADRVAREYVEELREQFLERKVSETLTRGVRFIQNDEASASKVLGEIQNILSDYNKYTSASVVTDVMDFDLAEDHYEEVRKRISENGGTAGIGTGFDFFDSSYPTGFQPGDLVVVLGWAQPHSEPILTPSGWATMGSLNVGDYVIGSNGQPIRVLETHERGSREVYRVNFSDGTYVLCDEDHLWTVQTSKRRQNGSGYVTLDTKTMLATGTKYGGRRNTAYRYYLPLPEPIEGTKTDFHLGPYLMGQLLSDGSYTKSVVQLTTNDPESIEICRNENPHLTIDEITCKTSTARQWSVRGGMIRHGLSRTLAHEKRIPDEYLLASAEQRLELLRGLMDGDGSVQYRRKAEFYTTSVGLSEDVADLVRSLGGVAKVRTVDSKVYVNGSGRVVSIWLPQNPFGIARKANKYSPSLEGFKAIDSIELAGYREEMKCIKVDSEDSLYVTRHYTLTHNTGRAKSFFTTYVACHAFKEGKTPMIASLEMNADKIRDRVWATMGAGIFKNTDLVMGDIEDSKFNEFKESYGSDKNKFLIVESDGRSELTPAAMQVKFNQYHPDVMIWDYAQIMSDNAGSENITQKMKNLSTEAKAFAVRNQIPVVLISSATPDGKVDDIPPTIEQVSWSKQLAYDADLAVAVHKNTDSNVVDIVCRKNRNGPEFAGSVKWDLNRGIIEEL